MRLAIFGDIHGLGHGVDRLTIDIMRELVAALDVEAVLQAGDMGWYRSFAKPVYWIYGNNDWVNMVRNIAEGKTDFRNLNLLPTGRVVTLRSGSDAVRVAGLNGAFEEMFYNYYPADRYRHDDVGRFFSRREMESCLGLRGVDIFLAHGCPAGLGFGREPDHGIPPIREVLDAVQPRYMFCGHAHFYREVHHNGTRVVSLAPARDEYYLFDTQTGDLQAVPTTFSSP